MHLKSKNSSQSVKIQNKCGTIIPKAKCLFPILYVLVLIIIRLIIMIINK